MKKEYVKPCFEQVTLAASGNILTLSKLNSNVVQQGNGETLAPGRRGWF